MGAARDQREEASLPPRRLRLFWNTGSELARGSRPTRESLGALMKQARLSWKSRFGTCSRPPKSKDRGSAHWRQLILRLQNHLITRVPPPHSKVNASPFWKKRLRKCGPPGHGGRGMGGRSVAGISGFCRGIILVASPRLASSNAKNLLLGMKLVLGGGEGRATWGRTSTPTYYKWANPDIARTGISPWLHYLLCGYFENRNPSESFDSAYYRSRHADVRDEGINPLLHYAMFGRQEERSQAPPLAPGTANIVRSRAAGTSSPLVVLRHRERLFARRAQTVR